GIGAQASKGHYERAYRADLNRRRAARPARLRGVSFSVLLRRLLRLLIKEGLNNPSFRRRPESTSLNFWIPPFAGMTKLGLIRVSLTLLVTVHCHRRADRHAGLNRRPQVGEHRVQRAEAEQHVALVRRAAHQADAPNLAGHSAQTGADLQTVFVQQA